MQELEEARVCRFCPEGRDAHERETDLYIGDYWYVTLSEYPYPGTSNHYLIVPCEHVTSFDELSDEAGAQLWAIRRKLKRETDPKATATIERSGDMAFNGGSVAHLHVHFLTLDDVPETPVKIRVSGHPAGGSQSAVPKTLVKENSGDR